LDGIPAAPRGVPRVEVSFDIDANGILQVTAKDEKTSREQKIKITASTNLSKDDVQRMVKEAAQHADEDRKLKDAAELRNESDTLCYSTEHLLKEAGSIISAEHADHAQELIAKLRESSCATVIDELAVKELMNELRNVLVLLEQDKQSATASS